MTATDQAVGAARAEQLLADRMTGLKIATGAWQPLPHQIPPPGDWYGWLLMAGRFAGKTDACADYMVKHVHGKPCMPGPVPHWMGVIGPTLGDASRACYSGPSGIRAHDPSARKVSRDGGTIIVWPNGAEAKLFGAHSEEDTDRLRAGGNTCIMHGTLVRAERGEVPIEDIKIGERVWTRNGLRRVLGVWDNGIKEVSRYDHDAGSTWMTPDHKVWTDQGWIEAGLVSPDDTVATWANTENRSSTAGRATPPRSPGTTATAAGVFSTGRSTRTATASSPTGTTSTTRITTSPTTPRPISNSSHPRNTPLTTLMRGTGTLLGAELHRRVRATAPFSASGAEQTSSPGAWPSGSGTAPVPAGTTVHEHGKNGCAWCAANGSPRSRGKMPVRVRAGALRSTGIRSVARVYDLTVEHDHEFFAGGVLLRNCLIWADELAAWRWLDQAWAQMRFGLRIGPRPRWIGSTTPRPRPLMKKMDSGLIRNTVVTHASSHANPHIIGEVLESLLETYGGTSLGAQEIEGRIVDQDENALWKREQIEIGRWNPDELPQLERITVGVDPSGGAGEQGIVVAGKTGLWTPPNLAQLQLAEIPVDEATEMPMVNFSSNPTAHGFVLADRTCHLKPDGWGKRAVQAAVDYEADDIVVETNYGKDMAIATIRTAAEAMGIPIPIRVVTATRGKRVRAEPVAALTANYRWHHAGVFEALEDQLATWTPELDWSPDRLDAMVWCPWHMKLCHINSNGVGSFGGGAGRRTIARTGIGRIGVL